MSNFTWAVGYISALLGFIAFAVHALGKKLDRIIQLLERDRN